MSQISSRLAETRGRSGLSLRAFADTLEERTGHRVAHDSARRYETGETRVPADYVTAVCRGFGVAPEWLLLGEGSPTKAVPPVVERAFEEIADIVRRVRGLRGEAPDTAIGDLVLGEWERFTRGLPPTHPVRDAIVESWARSRRAGVEQDVEELPLDRVPDEELRRRREDHRKLIEAARLHLEWVSAAINDLPHVVYLVCGDGIVLESVTTDPDLLDDWGLHPGFDWSEETMGTNGAGTALASESVVAVLGPEHYMRPSHGCSCLATPIRDSSGSVVGAIDVSMSFAGWRPDRLLFVAYAAEMIQRELEPGGSVR